MGSHFERLQIMSDVLDYHVRCEEMAVFPNLAHAALDRKNFAEGQGVI